MQIKYNNIGFRVRAIAATFVVGATLPPKVGMIAGLRMPSTLLSALMYCLLLAIAALAADTVSLGASESSTAPLISAPVANNVNDTDPNPQLDCHKGVQRTAHCQDGSVCELLF